jgi:hypothetical protein
MQEQECNFTYMLIALMIFLIGVPAATDLELLPVAMIDMVGNSALLAIGIWSLRGTGRAFYAAMAFASAAIILNSVHFAFPGPTLFMLARTSSLAYLLLATVASFVKIAGTNNMSGNRIIGAICVYFLLGVIWSQLYLMLEFAVPDSFGGLTGDTSVSHNPDWVYYSFVTLTTLGYGDILPLSFLARALAYMEAVVGQFYIAVLVAGLVSAYIAEKQGTQ